METENIVDIHEYIPNCVIDLLKEKIKYYNELDSIDQWFAKSISNNHTYYMEPDIVLKRNANVAFERGERVSRAIDKFTRKFDKLTEKIEKYKNSNPDEDFNFVIDKVSYMNPIKDKENTDHLFIGMPYYVMERKKPDNNGMRFFVFKTEDFNDIFLNASKNFDKSEWDYDHSTKYY